MCPKRFKWRKVLVKHGNTSKRIPKVFGVSFGGA
jgi:hypothetical protein